MNGDTENPLKCSICDKEFKSKSSCYSHIKNVHKKNFNGELLTEVGCACVVCDKKFTYKKNLKIHIHVVHSQQDGTNLLKCDKCNYSTAYKSNLKRHFSKHTHEKPLQLQNCPKCNAVYSSLRALKAHEKKSHTVEEEQREAIKRQCPLCPFISFAIRRSEINDHLEKIHELTLNKKCYSFESIKAFHKWRLEITKQTTSFYNLRNVRKNTMYYVCNRNGVFKPRGLNKRKLKAMGSCKINAYCPSGIKCFIDKKGGVNAEYMPLHVGHENELKYIRLTTEEREFIAKKIACNTPRQDILKMVRNTKSKQELQRLSLLTIKDIFNIERDFKLSYKVQKHSPDSVGVESWYHQLKEEEECNRRQISSTKNNKETLEKQLTEEKKTEGSLELSLQSENGRLQEIVYMCSEVQTNIV
ncbi:zinc finger protein 841-like [Homalodisca vitripennis]|uniref:zinc finger protein 841-like n=1 Tax=Homalodisca vitripennis TaxID=197043 RepID=UPI001EE9B716|nr:zinc finger protein 841-like [Homalodisca vitripennis]XP_046665817.1 zinc finger protein 841-like [Homalodisca vitripennis]XP_046665818.1 zinc finger protein 841-like [Homalodisca vitripennis]